MAFAPLLFFCLPDKTVAFSSGKSIVDRLLFCSQHFQFDLFAHVCVF